MSMHAGHRPRTAYSQIDYGKVFSAIFQLSNLVLGLGFGVRVLVVVRV